LDDSQTLTIGAIIVVVAILAGLLGRGCLVDDADATRAFENAGYTEIKIVSRHRVLPGFNGCSDSDAAAFVATATSPKGKPAKVVACSGWPFKGTVVRSF